MDFTNRSTQPQPAASSGSSASSRNKNRNKWARISTLVLAAAVAVLLLALIATVSFGGTKSEDKYVDTTKLQAVFLNTGQVYFGNIKAINDKYYVLTNIFYLQTNSSNGSSSSSASSSTSANNVTLVKLGCEIHQPYDQMVINTSQVTFWENLQASGQVAKAVNTFEQQNPNGQKCTDQSSSSSSSSTNATQNANSSAH